ncbi:hypothetical protein KC926_03830 [Candidatus Kaiserbacteria bacterium]|nr:hypothetical protein [Candidatus Kaiserbacteria bacterium]
MKRFFSVDRRELMSVSKIVFLSVLLSFGMQFIYAWTAPSGTAPAANVSGPITTGGNQIKTGSLTANGGLAAPSVVDTDNVSYYLNPSGSSVFSSLQTTGKVTSAATVASDSSSTLVTKGYLESVAGTGGVGEYAGTWVWNNSWGNCHVANQFSGGCSCPSGYSSHYVMTIENSRSYNMYDCWK